MLDRKLWINFKRSKLFSLKSEILKFISLFRPKFCSFKISFPFLCNSLFTINVKKKQQKKIHMIRPLARLYIPCFDITCYFLRNKKVVRSYSETDTIMNISKFAKKQFSLAILSVFDRNCNKH